MTKKASIFFIAILLFQISCKSSPLKSRKLGEKDSPKSTENPTPKDELDKLEMRIKKFDTREQNPADKIEADKIQKQSSGLCPAETEEVGEVGKQIFCQLQKGEFKGSKHGPFIKWSKDGVKTYQANFVEGELDGEEISFYIDGTNAELKTYQRGKQEGTWIKWNSSGNKVIEGSFIDNKKSGNFSYYYQDGSLKEEGAYQNEQKQGQWRYYNAYGAIKQMQTWVNGKKEGKAEEYYPSGVLSSSGFFSNNTQTAAWQYFYESSKIKSYGSMEDGRKIGVWVDYDLNGKLLMSKDFGEIETNVNSLKVGKQRQNSHSGRKQTNRSQNGFVSM